MKKIHILLSGFFNHLSWHLNDKLKIAVKILILQYRAFLKSKELTLTVNHISQLKKCKLILFCTLKNEAQRIPYFLNYYRNLGVEHFVFVDNQSTDGFISLVNDQSDVTVFLADGSYKESNFGMHWINYLLRKYGCGKWCLTCDPDEFIVYPYMDTRNLYDLTDYLGSIHRESFFTCMIDMYGTHPISLTYYASGQDPLEVCPYFDKIGYVKQNSANFRNIWMQGGVRRRVFFSDNPASAPALNKIPLIRWKWYFAYVESMHMALPRRLNDVVSHSEVIGSLLHFKFINQLSEKVELELVNKQHFNNSYEYRKYDSLIQSKETLYDSSISVKYQDWRTLYSYGLLNKGEW